MLNVEELSNHKPYCNIRVSMECAGGKEGGMGRKKELGREREDKGREEGGGVRKDSAR